MGFDVYGLNPNNPNNIDRPTMDWSVDHSDNEKEEYFKNVDAYENAVVGSYFRNNVWWWRPLWEFICFTCDDILTDDDMNEGTNNGGHKISKTKAKKIAARIRKLNKAGDIKKYEKVRQGVHEKMELEECDLCEGTGYRQPAPKAGKGDIPCNVCNTEHTKEQGIPIGKKEPWALSYPFHAKNVIQFGRFCEESGGFEIC